MLSRNQAQAYIQERDKVGPDYYAPLVKTGPSAAELFILLGKSQFKKNPAPAKVRLSYDVSNCSGDYACIADSIARLVQSMRTAISGLRRDWKARGIVATQFNTEYQTFEIREMAGNQQMAVLTFVYNETPAQRIRGHMARSTLLQDLFMDDDNPPTDENSSRYASPV